MFPKAENDKSILHRPTRFDRFTSQQFFKLIIREPMNPFRGVMSEKLDHASGRLQVFPHFVKSLQSDLVHLEPYREIHASGLPEEPPAFSSAEQLKIGKGFFMDSEALFKVRKKKTTLIRVCKSWP
jgi:hypothetical protein